MYYKTAFLRGKKPPFRGVFKYKDSDGEWRQTVRALEAKGKAEAKRELLEVRLKLEQEHERLEWESRESMTVYEYVESYIKSLEDVRALERSTVSIYGYLLKHIRDGIGNVRLKQLKADQVQAWEAMIIADGLSAGRASTSSGASTARSCRRPWSRRAGGPSQTPWVSSARRGSARPSTTCATPSRPTPSPRAWT